MTFPRSRTPSAAPAPLAPPPQVQHRRYDTARLAPAPPPTPPRRRRHLVSCSFTRARPVPPRPPSLPDSGRSPVGVPRGSRSRFSVPHSGRGRFSVPHGSRSPSRVPHGSRAGRSRRRRRRHDRSVRCGHRHGRRARRSAARPARRASAAGSANPREPRLPFGRRGHLLLGWPRYIPGSHRSRQRDPHARHVSSVSLFPATSPTCPTKRKRTSQNPPRRRPPRVDPVPAAACPTGSANPHPSRRSRQPHPPARKPSACAGRVVWTPQLNTIMLERR